MRRNTWAALACAALIASGAVVAQPPKAESRAEVKPEPAKPAEPAKARFRDRRFFA